MIPRPAMMQIKSDPFPSPHSSLFTLRSNSLTSQSPMSKISSASGSPRFETTRNGIRKLPSIGDFVAIGSSRPVSYSSATSTESMSTGSVNERFIVFSLDFEDEVLQTPTSLLRKKNKASVSREQFYSLLSRSLSPASEDILLSETTSMTSSGESDLIIFKIAEDAEEKLVTPPGAEEKAGYNISDALLSSSYDNDEKVKIPRVIVSSTAEEKSENSKVKLPSLATHREEKSSSSIPYHIQDASGSDKKQSPPALMSIHCSSSDGKMPSAQRPLLHKKPLPPGSKLLPDIAGPRSQQDQQQAFSRSPSYLLTERSLTPERGRSDLTDHRGDYPSTASTAAMRHSHSHT